MEKEELKVFPINEEYIEEALKFNERNEKIIKEIKDIFYVSLEEDEKNVFLNIINKDKNDNINENIKNNIIKKYVSISMIKSEKNNSHDIILFIPTENENIKKRIEEHIIKNNCNELLSKILYGSPYSYSNHENEDLNLFFKSIG